MAVRIRLTRIGRTNLAAYRIGVYDSRTPRDGSCIENLGTYDPHKQEAKDKVKLDSSRYLFWVSQGAKPTDNLASILKGAGLPAAAGSSDL